MKRVLLFCLLSAACTASPPQRAEVKEAATVSVPLPPAPTVGAAPSASASVDAVCSGDTTACRMAGCKALGGPAPDPAKARALFKAGCDGGYGSSDPVCANFGVMAAQGEGGPKDEQASARAAKAGCERGDARSCLLIGLLYRDGKGVSASEFDALDAFDKGCKAPARSHEACLAAKHMREKPTTSASSNFLERIRIKDLYVECPGAAGLGGLP